MGDTGLSERLVVWQVLAERRSAYDSLVWQTPALGLTAQAFLMTIALAPDVSIAARSIASVLGLLLSLMVMQLMAKHREGEMAASLALERLEVDLGFDSWVGTLPHGRPSARLHPADLETLDTSMRRLRGRDGSFWRASSVRLWILGQLGFAVAWLAVLVLVATGNVDVVAG